ncbi:MAG: MFS transporter [Deltaproteobacteria bacterium]|nr:MFS transporter [Deltaproteobacteria bacterium]MBW1977432.1 MFS transporter [Deltaproteobacteria bacterium]MBW2044540.1 MFS transporter [Deltaproteobacteria bacterium]MBW2300014.1 MFS transporter [Deltaproteobacteria bacterium]
MQNNTIPQQISITNLKRPEERWGILGVLSFCHFANDYYAMVVPPLLPFIAKDFHLSYFQAGLLVFMANIISAFLQPAIGYFADLKMLRKLTISFGLALYGVMSIALGLAPNYYILLVVLFLMGIGGSTYHAQSTYFINLYFHKFKATASGIHGLGNPIGFVAAPLAVSTLIGIGGSWRLAAMLMVFPGAIAALLAWTSLDEPRIEGPRGFLISFGSRPLLLLTLVNGLVLAVFIGFTTFLPFYSEEATCSIPASWWLPLTLLPGIISQPVGGLIADKIGRRNLILFALCVLVAGLFGFVYSAGSVALAFSMLIGFCLGMLAPVCFIFAAELAVGDRVGTAVGILWGFAMAMGALAPLWVGYLRDIFPDFRIAFMSLVLVALGAAVLSAFLPGKQALREFQSPTSSTVQP